MAAGRATMTAHVHAGVAALQADARVKTASSGASGFLSGSATANRNAAQRQRTRATPKHSYTRDATSSFDSSGPDRALPSYRTHERNEVQGTDAEALLHSKVSNIVQSLPIGARKVPAPEDDPHFLNLEPTSGIQLRTRTTSNAAVEAYLDCRTFVPISALYDICLPGPSDDGDFTIPIEGEWVTMGVLTSVSQSRQTQGCLFDFKGQKINPSHYEKLYDTYRARKGDLPDDINDHDNPRRLVKRELPPTEFRLITITDLGQPLVQNETRGDSMIQMLVVKADESYVDADGVRQYKGGSCGVYEMLDEISLGMLVCLLNPLVKGGSQNKETQGNDKANAFLAGKVDSWDESLVKRTGNGIGGKMLSLRPRSRNCVITIGAATMYGRCKALCKNGQECGDFVDGRTRLHACSYHLHNGATSTLKSRQEFANGTSRLAGGHRAQSGRSFKSFTQFKTYEEMACSQSRSYVSAGNRMLNERNKADPTNQFFRVDEQLGRDQEARRLRDDQKLRAEDERVRARLAVRSRNVRLDEQAKRVPTHCIPPETHGGARQSVAAAVAAAAAFAGKGHGVKAVQDALKKLNASSAQTPYSSPTFRPAQRTFCPPHERKRAASNAEPTDAKEGKSEAPRKRAVVDPFTGKLRQEREASGVSGDRVSSKLLARHMASAASLPKPILHVKQRKGLPNVRPPPGQHFHALDDSDDELDAALGALDDKGILMGVQGGHGNDDDESDIEIVG